MGANVSKAKRPKRRWIGITMPSDIQTKQNLIDAISSSRLSAYVIKPYDTYFSKTKEATHACSFLQIHDDVGVAILCVLLKDYSNVRSFLESENELQFISISSSGKLRLVRERMGLSKPPRR